MTGYCCTPKKGLNNDSSMSLLLNVVAARTKPPTGWPAAGNGGKCCNQEINGAGHRPALQLRVKAQASSCGQRSCC